MPKTNSNACVLSDAQIDDFISHGFVRLDGAFPRALADEARAILWRDTGCDPQDPATWTQPVIRLGLYAQPPFAAAANTPILRTAFDQLVGPGRWQPCRSLGTFPVRFPAPEDPGDAGWHIDVSFGTENPDFLEWRANVTSKGRALLMLFLFSDVGENEAPTRIRCGSHLDIARRLAPAGEDGLTLCASWRLTALRKRRGVRRCSQQAMRVRSISVTRFWSMRPSRIAEGGHVSLRSRRFCQSVHCAWNGKTATIRLSNGPSAALSIVSPANGLSLGHKRGDSRST